VEAGFKHMPQLQLPARKEDVDYILKEVKLDPHLWLYLQVVP